MRAAVSLGERCVTSQKTAAEETKENAEHLEKYATLKKNAAYLEKCTTLKRMRTLRKMHHT